MVEAYNYPILNLANREIIFYNLITKKNKLSRQDTQNSAGEWEDNI